MSRNRSITRLSENKLFVSPNQGTPIYLGTLPWESGSLSTYYARMSTMIDSTTPDGSVRVPLECSHTNHYASTLQGSNQVWLAPGLPSAYFDLSSATLISTALPSVPSPPWAQLASELVSQLDGLVQEGTLLGVTLAELGKTVAMIRNPFNLMRTDWRRIAHKATARELAKSSANLWLEHRYGWLSLLGDLKSFAKTYGSLSQRASADDLAYQTNRYSARTSASVTPSTNQYSTGSKSSWDSILSDWRNRSGMAYRWSCLYTGATAMYAMTIRQIQRQLSPLRRAHRMIHALGLSSEDILTTLWEMAPFSFVVDWFLDTRGIGYPFSILRLSQQDIRNPCYSVKLEQHYRAQFFLGAYTLYYNSPWTYQLSMPGTWTPPLCTGTTGISRSYQRYVGFPASGNFLENCTKSSLSVTQGISGAFLILQKMLK